MMDIIVIHVLLDFMSKHFWLYKEQFDAVKLLVIVGQGPEPNKPRKLVIVKMDGQMDGCDEAVINA